MKEPGKQKRFKYRLESVLTARETKKKTTTSHPIQSPTHSSRRTTKRRTEKGRTEKRRTKKKNKKRSVFAKVENKRALLKHRVDMENLDEEKKELKNS